MRKFVRTVLTVVVGAGLTVAISAGPALAAGQSWAG